MGSEEAKVKVGPKGLEGDEKMEAVEDMVMVKTPRSTLIHSTKMDSDKFVHLVALTDTFLKIVQTHGRI